MALIGDGRAYRDCKKKWVCLPMGQEVGLIVPILTSSWIDRGYEGGEEEKNQDVAFLGCLSFSVCDVGPYCLCVKFELESGNSLCNICFTSFGEFIIFF